MCAAAASGSKRRIEMEEDDTARAASITDEEERADGEGRRRSTGPGSPNVHTRGAAARNSPGTEAFPHSLDLPEGTLMVATTRNQKPTAIRSFVRQTLGFTLITTRVWEGSQARGLPHPFR